MDKQTITRLLTPYHQGPTTTTPNSLLEITSKIENWSFFTSPENDNIQEKNISL
jgi:hypothetical protein